MLPRISEKLPKILEKPSELPTILLFAQKFLALMQKTWNFLKDQYVVKK